MRYTSIDILRGSAILLMIQVHFVDNLSAREAANSWLYDISAYLGMLPAPLFTFVSGVSYALWLRKQEKIGRDDAQITKVSVRRGLFLFGAGIAFNVFVWLPEDTFDWDILTLIGSSLILLAFARKLPPVIIILICVLTLLVSPILRATWDYAAYWEDSSYTYDFTLQDVLVGYFVNAYFPLFPWILFPLMGFIVGEAAFPPEGDEAGFPWWLATTGAGLLALSLVPALFHAHLPSLLEKYYMTGLTMFPASTQYALGALGLNMICLVLLHRWIDERKQPGTAGLLGFFKLFSAYSLTVYVLHHMAHLWPLWIYGAFTEDEPTYYWRQAIGTPAALGLSLAFVAVCYCVLRVLDRCGKYGVESLMRWICE